MQLIVNWLLAVVHPVKVRLIDGDHIGQTLVSIIDTQEKQLNKRNTYFWSMVLQVSVHAHMVLHSFKEISFLILHIDALSSFRSLLKYHLLTKAFPRKSAMLPVGLWWGCGLWWRVQSRTKQLSSRQTRSRKTGRDRWQDTSLQHIHPLTHFFQLGPLLTPPPKPLIYESTKY